jgi:hypothetical protein
VAEQEVESYRAAQLVAVGKRIDQDVRTAYPAIECRDEIDSGIARSVGGYIRRLQFDPISGLGQGYRSPKVFACRAERGACPCHRTIGFPPPWTNRYGAVRCRYVPGNVFLCAAMCIRAMLKVSIDGYGLSGYTGECHNLETL